MTDLQALAMTALKDARYHEDREAFLLNIARWSDLVQLLAGAGIVTTIVTKALPGLGIVLGLVTALLAGLQLVFGISQRAQVHGSLRRRFLEIYAEATAARPEAADLDARLRALYAEEPPTFHAANALAYNAAQRAFDRPEDTLLIVPGWRRALRHFLRAEGVDFRSRGEFARAT